MPAVTRLGDRCTGHGAFGARENDSAASTVYANNIAVHRSGDHWVTHCDSTPTCHDSTTSGGSDTVWVENRKIARIGDHVACGSSIAQGSGNVFAG